MTLRARLASRPVLIAGGVAAVLLLGSSPWWGRRLLSEMSFFRVRRVDVRGVRYLSAGEVVDRLGVDTATSLWTDTGPLERRVAAHPQVRGVRIARRLPSTLVVHVTENMPVAFLPSTEGMRVLDADGRVLPIDPSHSSVDLPVVARPDTAVLRLLAEVRGRLPDVYARIGEVRRAGRDELVIALASISVRAMADVTPTRIADILPVESDLARRGARAIELDLRFRDQVIARLP